MEYQRKAPAAIRAVQNTGPSCVSDLLKLLTGCRAGYGMEARLFSDGSFGLEFQRPGGLFETVEEGDYLIRTDDILYVWDKKRFEEEYEPVSWHHHSGYDAHTGCSPNYTLSYTMTGPWPEVTIEREDGKETEKD